MWSLPVGCLQDDGPQAVWGTRYNHLLLVSFMIVLVTEGGTDVLRRFVVGALLQQNYCRRGGTVEHVFLYAIKIDMAEYTISTHAESISHILKLFITIQPNLVQSSKIKHNLAQ